MSSEWQTVEIGSLCLGIYDGPHATPKKTAAGPIFLGISSLNDGQLNLSELEYLSEEDFAKWTKRVVPQAGDIVFSYETRLGQVAVIPAGLRCCLGRRMALMRVDPAKVISDYLLYAYLSPDFQEVIRQRTIHGSTVDRIPLVEFGTFPISVPPLDVQKEAVGILRALDDRITLLRETNTTLEAIAQALFKSWFVDFDPVRAKMEGRPPEGMDEATAALFPDGFEESALGLVPRGWQPNTLIKLTAEYGGRLQTGPFGSQLHASDYVEDGIPVVMPKDIKDRRATTDTVARIRLFDAERLARHQLMKGDIVFSRRGDVERHALISEREVGWICGTGCLLLRPGTAWISPTFLSMVLDAPQARTWLVQHAVGATMPNINTAILGSVPVLLPPDGVLSAFEEVISTTEAQRSQNSSMAETLATLRDTLLPRLISGQLRLPDAESEPLELAA
ncbi:restriction endonuclease subunit S [Polaromonas sp.]|uniref:restriction endonuclease subunit S n=1 Tax=Polaromonas sp. TaxID=1869339 RepID=UPI0013B9EB51|nr:restriction endonuclease subunit S [Polaromonas sp.]NDP64315.1 restriction endonuclease subunit S [Polaromonas sp.]